MWQTYVQVWWERTAWAVGILKLGEESVRIYRHVSPASIERMTRVMLKHAIAGSVVRGDDWFEATFA